MPRLPLAVASYGGRRAPAIAQRPSTLKRVAACLATGAVWLVLMLVARDQVARSVFLIKLLAAPFAFSFVVAAVELPRLLLGVSLGELAQAWDGMAAGHRAIAAVLV